MAVSSLGTGGGWQGQQAEEHERQTRDGDGHLRWATFYGMAPRRAMSDHPQTMRATQVIGLSLFVLTATVAAQVPVNNEPHHRTAFENADFRRLLSCEEGDLSCPIPPQ